MKVAERYGVTMQSVQKSTSGASWKRAPGQTVKKIKRLDDELILSLRESGMTFAQIASEVGASVPGVWHAWNRAKRS